MFSVTIKDSDGESTTRTGSCLGQAIASALADRDASDLSDGLYSLLAAASYFAIHYDFKKAIEGTYQCEEIAQWMAHALALENNLEGDDTAIPPKPAASATQCSQPEQSG